MSDGLPPGEEWVRAFQRRHGRPPRVLHIGNIANNAYNNARLMRKAGLDCDVISHNDYHIMASPEWEDADFEGDVGDQFRPDWTRVDLRGFQRPGWFAQGPKLLCIEYLAARRRGKRLRAALLWRRLQYHNRTRRGFDTFMRLRSAWLHATGLARRSARAALTPSTIERKVASRPLRIVLVEVSKGLRLLVRPFADDPWPTPVEEVPALASELKAGFEAAFPGRRDVLCDEDMTPYSAHLSAWKRLFGHYDVVQGYATAPIVPMLAGQPYFALEHGTLRDLPFAENAIGRLTALAYRRAEHAFVTNIDCLENAGRLCGERHTFINHPYDEDHGFGVAGSATYREALLRELSAEFLFFFPTRHDWVTGTGFADKANDVFLRAFVRLRRAGLRVGMVTCRWGRNVDASRELLADEGCSQYVRWVEPMGMVRFERAATAVDIVVDQFKLGAFGGVTFKSLAVGAAVCTFVDNDAVRNVFPEPPPVINCRIEDEIVTEVTRLSRDPAQMKALGQASRRWMQTHHGSAAVVAEQLRLYRQFLDGRASAATHAGRTPRRS